MIAKPLHAHSIPLSGKHLIEASAGTGKTFNITRLYLRLLLEKGFTVEQILVMTFTKDATEEIRGRIGEVLRESLNHWSSLTQEEEFYRHLAEHISEEQAKAKLKQALLYLDEASIFTLHGFCKRVLSQYAFQSGLSFDLDMDTSGKDIIIEASQDWYRLLAKDRENDFLSICQFWPNPQRFIEHFASAIGKTTKINVRNEDDLIAEFNVLVNQVKTDLTDNNAFITEHLIDSKKGKDREQRLLELSELINWLSAPLPYDDKQLNLSLMSPLPVKFFDGRRFPKALKPKLIDIFFNANKLKAVVSKFAETVLKIRAYKVVRQGIIEIGRSIEHTKIKQKRLTFDDLISTLATQLANDQSTKLSQLLRQQYPVAMVDEFQDTDTAQFEILKAMYPLTETNALYLIGDPKQAIYGFRGGDIFTYLSARDFCQYQWVMDTNWRSTQHMINGYNRLFYGTPIDAEGADTFGFNIPYQPVNASPKAKEKIDKYTSDKALQFVYFNPENDSLSTVKQDFRPTMALWCANKIKHLLNDENYNCQPQDIAILVRDGGEANEIKLALQSIGLTGVFLSNRSNLWHSEQASQILLLLKAILYVEHDRFFVAGLASGLLPFDHINLERLQQDEVSWQNLKFDFLSLREEWLSKSFISMAIRLLHDHIRVPKNDKDRTLTNILHLFELLQSSSERYKQPQELMYWFEQQVNIELTDAEAELRLESDEDLIKIVTQHGSKGLEYPIVFVPFASRYKDPTKVGNRKLNVIHYHDENGKQSIDLGSDSVHINRMAEEAYAEAIRLLYVAVTRAEQQCFLLVANFEKSHFSPLGLTLKWSEDKNIEDSLMQLAQENPSDIGYLSVNNVEIDYHGALVDVTTAQEQPVVPKFNGKIERDWWLSSFTALSKNLRHVGVSSPDRDIDSVEQTPIKEGSNASSMRFALTKGAITGNFLHEIFEQVDFTQPQWRDSIPYYFDKYPELLKQWQINELCQWLSEIVTTPLVEAANFESLSQDKMLHEAEFYFPMRSADTSSLTNILSSHRQRFVDKNSTIKHVKLPHYQTLKGMMHGFIDLIFEYDGKFYVCDYKSNYLGDDYSDYQQEHMQKSIQEHHYDLQYLIYSLALHRQLKITIENYNPNEHFGGVIYCYLRGMTPNNDGDTGVFLRDILSEELDQLDQLFGEEQGG